MMEHDLFSNGNPFNMMDQNLFSTKDLSLFSTMDQSPFHTMNQKPLSMIDPKVLNFCRAVTCLQWDTVINIARTGIHHKYLKLAFWTAIRQDMWGYAMALAILDSGQRMRNVVIKRAVRHSCWENVCELLKHGVGCREESIVLRNATELGVWEYIACMVRYCHSLELKRFAITEAIQCCQWTCVSAIVEFGRLNEELKEYVCNEALSWRQWSCVVELLKQGVSEVYTQLIVQEAFKWNQWHLLTSLVKKRVTNDVTKVMLAKTAIAYSPWKAYTDDVSSKGVNDKLLIKIMKELVLQCVDNLLHLLITCLRNGRRVFKQLCAKQLWKTETAFLVYNGLLVNDEVDLAFHVAVTYGMWNLVIILFDDVVSMRARRFAFLHAVKLGVWEYVAHMSHKPGIKSEDTRYAFLEAVRRDECRWALDFYNQFAISDDDVESAVASCIAHGHWDIVVEFCVLCKTRLARKRVAFFAIRKAKEASNWECIASFLKWKDFYARRNFLVNFQGSIFTRSLRNYILNKTRILHKRDLWHVCAAELAEAYKALLPETMVRLFGSRLRKMKPRTLSKLAKYCMAKSYVCFSIFLSAVGRDWSLAKKFVKQFHELMDEMTSEFLVIETLKVAEWETAATLLQFIPVETFTSDISVCILMHGELCPLVELCKNRNLTKWAITLALWTGREDFVYSEVSTCQDLDIITYIIRQATCQNSWNVVENLINKHPHDEAALLFILKLAVDVGNIVVTERIMPRVDPLSATVSKSLLCRAVCAQNNREEMVRLCIRSGLSTYQALEEEENENSLSTYFSSLYFWSDYFPLRKALYNGQMPLIKLLCVSGSCSNREFYRLKANSELKSRLEGQGRDDILRYLYSTASNPRRLQELCRLTVSHLIGCHPGRRERVKCLEIPEVVKEFILFEDI